MSSAKPAGGCGARGVFTPTQSGQILWPKISKARRKLPRLPIRLFSFSDDGPYSVGRPFAELPEVRIFSSPRRGLIGLAVATLCWRDSIVKILTTHNGRRQSLDCDAGAIERGG